MFIKPICYEFVQIGALEMELAVLRENQKQVSRPNTGESDLPDSDIDGVDSLDSQKPSKISNLKKANLKIDQLTAEVWETFE